MTNKESSPVSELVERLRTDSKGTGSFIAIVPLHALRHEAADRLTALEAEVARKDAEIERLREALTQSGTTKAAYWGEFHERIEVANPNYEDGDDGEPETIVQQVPVSWTTVKKIMAAISTRAALSAPKGGEHE